MLTEKLANDIATAAHSKMYAQPSILETLTADISKTAQRKTAGFSRAVASGLADAAKPSAARQIAKGLGMGGALGLGAIGAGTALGTGAGMYNETQGLNNYADATNAEAAGINDEVQFARALREQEAEDNAIEEAAQRDAINAHADAIHRSRRLTHPLTGEAEPDYMMGAQLSTPENAELNGSVFSQGLSERALHNLWVQNQRAQAGGLAATPGVDYSTMLGDTNDAIGDNLYNAATGMRDKAMSEAPILMKGIGDTATQLSNIAQNPGLRLRIKDMLRKGVNRVGEGLAAGVEGVGNALTSMDRPETPAPYYNSAPVGTQY